MSFRVRVFLAILLPAVGVLFGLGWWGRTQVLHRLETSFDERFDADVRLLGEELRRIDQSLESRLEGAAKYLVDDARFRVALLQRDEAERRLLVDAAGHLRPLTGLDAFEILDAQGLLLSSGHFRESHGQSRARVLPQVDAGTFLAEVRTRSDSRRVWAKATSLVIAGRTYVVWGGIDQDSAGPSRDGGDSRVAWVQSGAAAPPIPEGRRFEVEFPSLDLAGNTDAAEVLVLTSTTDSWAKARTELDRWLLFSLGLVALAALVLSGFIARWIEQPVRELIDHTLQVRIGRSSSALASSRKDEFGELGRFIDSMVTRLRASGEELRHAERKATQGEMARQVHHDVKNGVLPLSGVVRHLKEVAENDPEELANVYRERVGTLETGLDYLENLTRQYARISSRGETTVVDVEGILRDVVDVLRLESGHLHFRSRQEAARDARELAGDGNGDGSGDGVDLVESQGPLEVQASAVDLRRILENLVRNALEAVEATSNPRVDVGSCRVTEDGRDWVLVDVRDNGPGMSEEIRARVFEPFYTTKEAGTGLGLAISRRLVTDIGGRLQIESREGGGTRCLVRLPAAP